MDRRKYLAGAWAIMTTSLAGCPATDRQQETEQTTDKTETAGGKTTGTPTDTTKTEEGLDALTAATRFASELSLPFVPRQGRRIDITSANRARLERDIVDALRLLFVPGGDGQSGALPIEFEDWLSPQLPPDVDSTSALIADTLDNGAEVSRIDWMPTDGQEGSDPVFSSYSILDEAGHVLFDSVVSSPVLTSEWLQWMGRANFGLKTHAILAYRSIRMVEQNDADKMPPDQYTEIYGWDAVQTEVAGSFERYQEGEYEGLPRVPKEGPQHQGAVADEDEFTRGDEYNLENDSFGRRRLWANYFRHFYDPEADHGLYRSAYFDFFKRVRPDLAAQADVGDQFFDALQWGYNAQSDGFTWRNAIRAYDYSEESKKVGWETFGHLLHLLQDMNEPDHTAPAGQQVVRDRSAKYPGQAHPDASKFLDAGQIATVFGNAQLRGYEGYVDSVLSPIPSGLESIGLDETPAEKESLKSFFDAAARESQADWKPPRGEAAIGLRRLTEAEIDTIEDEKVGPVFGTLMDIVRTFNDIDETQIPAAPMIDILDPDRPYPDLAERHIRRSQQYGAGFLQYCYELVNPPPFVKSVRIEAVEAATIKGWIVRQWLNDWQTHDTSDWDRFRRPNGVIVRMPHPPNQIGRVTGVREWELASRHLCTAGDFVDEQTIWEGLEDSINVRVQITFGPTASTGLTACSENDPGKKGPYPKRIDEDAISVRIEGPESQEVTKQSFSQAEKTADPSPATWVGVANISTPGEYTVRIDAEDDEPHHDGSFGRRLDKDPASPARLVPGDSARPGDAESQLTVRQYEPAVSEDTHQFTIE